MPLDEAYFRWLYSQVGSTKLRNRAMTYWTLLSLLYRKEFVAVLVMDENRAQDGKDLRQEFIRESNIVVDEDWLQMPCSFLELLIALSFKLAFDGGGETKDWFWILIDNLGLTECTDAYPPDEEIVDHILDKVMARKYSKNGTGGLFPLARAEDDQRRIELHYQAEAFLLERL